MPQSSVYNQRAVPVGHKEKYHRPNIQTTTIPVATPLPKSIKEKQHVDSPRIVPATHYEKEQNVKLGKSRQVAVPLFKHLKTVNSSNSNIKPALQSIMEVSTPESQKVELSLPEHPLPSKDAVQQITLDVSPLVTGNIVLQESIKQASITSDSESLSVEQLESIEPDSATSSKTQYHKYRQLAGGSYPQVPSVTTPDWSNIAITTKFAELLCSGNNMSSLTALDLSDCMLELQLGSIIYILPLHTTAITTNPKFERLIAQSREQGKYDQHGRVKIKKHSNAVGLTIDFAIGAISTLYGARPSDILDKYLNAQEHPDNRNIAPIYRMATAIKFFFAGGALGIWPVMKAALKIIKEELSFDNLELAMTSALFGSVHHSDHNPYDQEFWSNFLEGTLFELGRSLNGYHSEYILMACLNFLVENFPEAYSFDPSALISIDLGGVFLDDDESVSDLNPTRPRPGTLQAIEFGSFTAIIRHHSLVSTILLSAPFPILEHLYRRLSEQDQVIDLEEVLRARNLRYQRRIQSATTARAEILEMQLMGEEVHPEFFGRAFIPDRALWFEESEINEQGRVQAVRFWLGDPGIHAV